MGDAPRRRRCGRSGCACASGGCGRGSVRGRGRGGAGRGGGGLALALALALGRSRVQGRLGARMEGERAAGRGSGNVAGLHVRAEIRVLGATAPSARRSERGATGEAARGASPRTLRVTISANVNAGTRVEVDGFVSISRVHVAIPDDCFTRRQVYITRPGLPTSPIHMHVPIPVRLPARQCRLVGCQSQRCFLSSCCWAVKLTVGLGHDVVYCLLDCCCCQRPPHVTT
jgi:hypothetical protein